MRRPRIVTLVVVAATFATTLPVAAAVTFTVSIDKAALKRWGLRYPATYIFEVSSATADSHVKCRDGESGSWSVLESRTADDFFNGIECVRFDKEAGKAFVSIGFRSSDALTLEFANVSAAKFVAMARYYDDRKAAYTLSNDNWGCNPWAHPGAPWKGPTNDESDNYQAALHVCRSFHIPLSIAINSRSAGGQAMWNAMQRELDREDNSWEPAVHGWTHPKTAAEYAIHGLKSETLGCREDILTHLKKIPYGQYVLEHILTTGYVDDAILGNDSGEFLFIRGFNWLDNPTSVGWAEWNKQYKFYGVYGLNTKGYDRIMEQREPRGRFNAADVEDLNKGFDEVLKTGGVFYALWHPDRFRNSVIYDPAPGVDGRSGSTLMQHLTHVANRKDVWYVANGWMYAYRYVAENARVAAVTD